MVKRTMQLSNIELREEIEAADVQMSDSASSSSSSGSNEEVIENIPIGSSHALVDDLLGNDEDAEYGEDDLMGFEEESMPPYDSEDASML